MQQKSSLMIICQLLCDISTIFQMKLVNSVHVCVRDKGLIGCDAWAPFGFRYQKISCHSSLLEQVIKV